MSKKHDTEIDDKGLFWWHGTPCPAKQFAPNDAVAGDIRQGRTFEIDLIGTLDDGPFAPFKNRDEGALDGKSIQGKLFSSNDSVLVLDLVKNGGGVSSHGISREGYIGLKLLQKQTPFAEGFESNAVKSLKVWLTGMEEWLLEGTIDFERDFDKGDASAKYTARSPIVWEDKRGDLTLSFFLGGTSISLFRTQISLEEEYALTIEFVPYISIEDSLDVYRSLANLLLLLTGQHSHVSWPIISVERDKDPVTARFWLGGSEVKEIRRHDCWVLFPQIKGEFGALFYKWQELEKRMGSAVFLLLSLYRTNQIYAEHSFSNIVWAIESFSRKLGNLQPSSETEDRIASILKSVSSGDTKFLAKKLRYAAEPNLEQRITDVLFPICTGVSKKSFNKFATKCAKMRNDLAHHGGPQSGTYKDFARQMREYTELLKRLHHLRLLSEIGITMDDIAAIQETSRHSIDFDFWKRRCGLESNNRSKKA